MTRSSFRKDVLWTLLTQVLVMLFAFGITKIASNILTVDEFGQYNIVRRSVSVISFVMLAGMGITLPRYLAIYQGARHYREMIDLVFSSLLFVGVVCLIVLLGGILCSGSLVQLVTGGSDTMLYYFALLFAFSTTVSSLLIAYYRGINDFKNYSITQVSFQFLLLLSFLIIPRQNVSAIFLIWTIATLAFTLVYFINEIHHSGFIVFKTFRYNCLGERMKTIVLYSFPRLVGDFLLFSFSAFPVIYLSQATTLTEVAYYSVGLTVINMATPFFSFLGVVLLPYVSGAVSRGQFHEVEMQIRRLSVGYLLLALVLTLIFWVFMPYIIRAFFSSDYIASEDVSRILLLSVLPQSMYLLYRNPIDAVATFPYNTLILFVSCIVLFLLFSFSKTLSDYSYSFVLSSSVQGGLSMAVWMLMKNKIEK